MEASPDPWISALRHSHDRLRASVEPLGPDQLTQRSYPSEWTIAQVLSHLGSQAEIFGLILEAGLAGQEPPAREEFPPIWDKWNAKDPQAQATDALRADQATLERLESMDADERERLHLKLFGMDIDADRLCAAAPQRARGPHLGRAGRARPGGHAGPGRGRPAHRHGGPGRGQEREAGRPAAQVRVSTTDPERQFILATGDEVTLTPSDGDATPELGLSELRLPAEALIRLVYGRLDEAHTPPAETAGVELDELRQIFRGF
jgi:Mycothiol maleylpyruvate isomerase N-terminal domain.